MAQIEELQILAVLDSLQRLDQVVSHVQDQQLLTLEWVQKVDPAEHVLAEVDASQVAVVLLASS